MILDLEYFLIMVRISSPLPHELFIKSSNGKGDFGMQWYYGTSISNNYYIPKSPLPFELFMKSSWGKGEEIRTMIKKYSKSSIILQSPFHCSQMMGKVLQEEN
jgi:hypothetical protein